MEKCKEIGIHLTESDYYGATEDSRGITDIYCNIEGKPKKVHFINASVVAFEDKVEACLKCSNLDENVRKRILCKHPYEDTYIQNKTGYSHLALTCHYSNYIANEEKSRELELESTIFEECHEMIRTIGDYPRFKREVCDECYLNPKNCETLKKENH